VGDIFLVAPASSTQISVGGRDDGTAAPQGVTQPPEEPVQIASGRVRKRGCLTRRLVIHLKNYGDEVRQMKDLRSVKQMNNVVEGERAREASVKTI